MKQAHISIAVTQEELSLIRKYRKKYGNVSLTIRTILKRYDDMMKYLEPSAEKLIANNAEVSKDDLAQAVLLSGPDLAVEVVASSPIGETAGGSVSLITAATNYLEGLL